MSKKRCIYLLSTSPQIRIFVEQKMIDSSLLLLFFFVFFFIISRRGDNQLFIFQPLCLSRTCIEMRNCLRNNMKHSLTRRGDEIHGSLPFMKEINFIFFKETLCIYIFLSYLKGVLFLKFVVKEKDKSCVNHLFF